jgi:S-adenosylmethionine synthetase
VRVNTADDLPRESIYLTVTGTSAEAGDDGQTGRGNRANGLITPFRPMTLEAVRGKNPITHVGKLYNVAAARLAAALVAEAPSVVEAECHFVSEIGAPIDAPPLAFIALRTLEDHLSCETEQRARWRTESSAGCQISGGPFWRKTLSWSNRVLSLRVNAWLRPLPCRQDDACA